jgi:antitoxin component HigA of HigAB toxin-antitoxin module
MSRTTTTRTRKKRFAPPADYLELVKRFPVRRLENEADHAAATGAVEPLVGRRDLTRGEEMYLDALGRFIELYEEQNHPVRASDPVELLKGLMDNRRMNVSDLGAVVGSQPLASMILNRRRGISKASIAKLAKFFRVDPGAFIGRRAPVVRGRRLNRAQ